MDAADQDGDGIDQVLRVLVPVDPRRSAQKALAHLCADTGAVTGAVFSTSVERVDLRDTVGSIDQVLLDQAQSGWCAARERLERGEAWHDARSTRAYLLLPLVADAGLVGLLYLDFLSPDHLQQTNERTLNRIARILAACVATPDGVLQEDDLTSHLARTTARELRRAQLVAHLAATGGNIQEVARRMGKSRPTIYAWMDEFGIPRRRENRLRRAES